MEASYRNWAGTRGEGSEVNSLQLGYFTYVFKGEQEFPLYFGKWDAEVGKITMSDFLEMGEHFLEVKVEITSGEWSLYESYLYAGSAEGYEEYLVELEGLFYTQYLSFPSVEEEHAAVRIFKINVDAL